MQMLRRNFGNGKKWKWRKVKGKIKFALLRKPRRQIILKGENSEA